MKITLLFLTLLLIGNSGADSAPSLNGTRSVTIPIKQIPANATSIYIYRERGNSGFLFITSLPPTSTSYVDKNVHAHTTYFYKAKTYCSNCSIQLSVYSNTVSAKIP